MRILTYCVATAVENCTQFVNHVRLFFSSRAKVDKNVALVVIIVTNIRVRQGDMPYLWEMYYVRALRTGSLLQTWINCNHSMDE